MFSLSHKAIISLIMPPYRAEMLSASPFQALRFDDDVRDIAASRSIKQPTTISIFGAADFPQPLSRTDVRPHMPHFYAEYSCRLYFL